MLRFLITFALSLLAVGLAWKLVTRVGLGRLPGDFVIELGRRRLTLPIATALLLSLVLSALLWLFAPGPS